LITGATGFIGGHVAERLASDGHQLHCLVRETSRLEILEPLGAELVYGSITDRDAVESAVEGMDVVMHVAGMTSAQRYQQMLSVNRDGSWHVARARQAAGPGGGLLDYGRRAGPPGTGSQRAGSAHPFLSSLPTELAGGRPMRPAGLVPPGPSGSNWTFSPPPP
jgi:NAD(P)-dependent dehydrogenase (short-subunit alcohol dehydrogenase family)